MPSPLASQHVDFQPKPGCSSLSKVPQPSEDPPLPTSPAAQVPLWEQLGTATYPPVGDRPAWKLVALLQI